MATANAVAASPLTIPMAEAAATIATGSVNGAAVGVSAAIVSGNIAGIAVKNSVSAMRSALSEAGYVGQAITNLKGTESGTQHVIPHLNMIVRVMEGGANHPPRAVTNSLANPNQLVNPATGKPFANMSKAEQASRSHFTLSPE